MRRAIMTAIVAATVCAGTARAQISGAGANVFGGAPRQIVNTPIDTSRAMTPSGNINKAFKTPSAATNSPFNISKVFPKITMPSWPPKTPQVSVLPQSQNQFQPTPPKGAVSMFDVFKKK